MDTGNQPEVYNFTRSVSAGTTDMQYTMAQVGSSNSDSQFSVQSIQIEPNNVITPWSGGASYMQKQQQKTAAVTNTAISPNDYCGYSGSVISSTQSWTTIGELHNAKNSVATFTYGSITE